MTSNSTVVPMRQPEETDDPLTAIPRNGARQLLVQAVEAEAEAFLATMKAMRLVALLRADARAGTPVTNALAAMMCLHAARLPLRFQRGPR